MNYCLWEVTFQCITDLQHPNFAHTIAVILYTFMTVTTPTQ